MKLTLSTSSTACRLGSCYISIYYERNLDNTPLYMTVNAFAKIANDLSMYAVFTGCEPLTLRQMLREVFVRQSKSSAPYQLRFRGIYD